MAQQQKVLQEYWDLFWQCYDHYRSQSPEEQKAQVTKNLEVQTMIRNHRPETGVINLRSLYIQSLMHRLQLQRADLSPAVRKSLEEGRLALVVFIRERFDLKERIVPDTQVETAAVECRNNPDLLLNALGQWIADDTKRKLFIGKIQLEIQRKNQKKQSSKDVVHDWIMSVLMANMELALTTQDVSNFESFYNMLECVQRYMDLSS